MTLSGLKAIMSADPVPIDGYRLSDEAEAKQMGFHHKTP